MGDVLRFAIKNVPGAQNYVDSQTDNIIEELRKDIASKPLPEPRFTHLPEESLSREEIIKILEVWRIVNGYTYIINTFILGLEF